MLIKKERKNNGTNFFILFFIKDQVLKIKKKKTMQTKQTKRGHYVVTVPAATYALT